MTLSDIEQLEDRFKTLVADPEPIYVLAAYDHVLTLCTELKKSLEREIYAKKTAIECLSIIRRGTDDMPELKDINRMAREALAKMESIT
jgi:hypothetical protein